MLPMRVAVLSGYSGARSSMFAGSAGDIFSLGSSGLGKSDSSWLNDAKTNVALFDELVLRTRKIANKTVREDLAKEYIGAPDDRNNGQYRRNGTAGNVATAESYTPVNTYFFSSREVQNRTQRLVDWNADFQAAVADAERQYGSLPDPQIIETVKEVSSTPGWVPVVVVGALGVAALAALGVFKK
jgi:hypothetical protein